MKGFKIWIGLALFFVGLIGIIACAIAACVFAWKNPDMTEIRRFLEYPWPTVWCIVDVVAMEVGRQIVENC